MILAVCAQEEGLQAETDQRFGRCPIFVLIDSESGEVLENLVNSSVQASGGAGPQAAQLLSRKKVGAVVLGNVGPNAIAALEAAKIKVYSGIGGTVSETLDKFKNNKLNLVAGATVDSHSGMKG